MGVTIRCAYCSWVGIEPSPGEYDTYEEYQQAMKDFRNPMTTRSITFVQNLIATSPARPGRIKKEIEVKKYTEHNWAVQVQPQSGQRLVEHRDVLLRECSQKTYRLNPQADQQALEGQTLHEDEGGYLYLAR